MSLDKARHLDEVRRVADAVLYEGYVLYPYRASAQKNRSRWQFGVLMPPAYARADPSEAAVTRAECVFEHSGAPAVTVTVRFLQVQRRTAEGPGPDAASAAVPPSWDEAVEREVTLSVAGSDLFGSGRTEEFTVPGGVEEQPEHDQGGDAGGARVVRRAHPLPGSVPPEGARVVRRRQSLAGSVSVRATGLPGPWRAARLAVEVANQTDPPEPCPDRAAALPFALVAAHMIISVSGGAFVSMTDPPQWASAQVAACWNVGCWPVLAGPDRSREVMLASPLILPDHPQVAPESAGELYDGTEIDEILTLRTLALTDEEKAAARATDARAAALIDRVEGLDEAAMARLHGTIRPMQGPGKDVPWWDPGADASVSPGTDSIQVAGQRVARGSRVTLRPGSRRADAQDMFLQGRPAMVEAVLFDVDDTPYLAVSLADDPAADLGAAHGRFLYFSPDEVVPQ